MTIGQSSVDMSLWARYKLSLCVCTEEDSSICVSHYAEWTSWVRLGAGRVFQIGAFLHMWHLRTLSTITYYSLLHTFGMLLSLHMRPLHSLLSYRLLLGTVLYALPTLHVCALGVAGGI